MITNGLKNILEVQISSVRFPKDRSVFLKIAPVEWFIVTADFGDFREVKHLLIIFSLSLWVSYKNLDFYCVWNVEFCVNQAAFARGFSALIGRKVRLKPIECLSKFMMTLFQLINHVDNDFKDGDFSIEDKPRSGQPQKFEDKELEALLEENQSQTQEELAESLGATSLFCTIESHGNDSKTRKLGALWTETERHWKAIFQQLIQRQQRKGFFASDCD